MANKAVPFDPLKARWRDWGILLLLPFFLVGLLIVYLPFLAVAGFIRERWFRRKLRLTGRFITLRQLRPRLNAGEGTLIEEWGPKGPYHIWWTDENIMARGTPPTEHECNEMIGGDGKEQTFNTLCVKDYLEPETGRALLTNMWPLFSNGNRLMRRFPGVPVVKLVPWPKSSGLTIVAFLPVHEGQSAIKIANLTDQSVNLKHWEVYDGRTGESFRIEGEVPPGGDLVVNLAGSRFLFNVDGGEVVLGRPGVFPQRVTYTEEQVRRGEWVEIR